MKAIINWIILIPVLILAVGVELFTALDPNGATSFFGLDANGVSEIIIISLIVLFVLFFVLSLFDRKTSPVHLLRRNYPAGICCMIAAFSLAGDTAARVAESLRGSGLGAIDVIVMIVSAIAAVALLFAGINHCTGNNTKNGAAVLYLAVPLWCAVHLLSRFMSHTAQPVSMAETLDLVMYVFMAIYFMYAMMVISLVNGRNPVKAAIFWGAPAAVASLVYAVSVIGINLNAESASVFDYLDAVTCGFIGLYIISFIAELSFMSKTKEEQKVLEEATEDADEQENDVAEDSGFVDVNIQSIGSSDIDSPVDNVEVEINQNMKKFFNDISSVESEIEPEEEVVSSIAKEDEKSDPSKDYGKYFDTEESDDMYIESENLAVDTTKKHYVDKSKYPVSNEKTVQQHAVRDEYVVGIDQVGNDVAEELSMPAASKQDLKKAEDSANEIKSDNYEARLDEIDRLIISIQGGDDE